MDHMILVNAPPERYPLWEAYAQKKASVVKRDIGQIFQFYSVYLFQNKISVFQRVSSECPAKDALSEPTP